MVFFEHIYHLQLKRIEQFRREKKMHNKYFWTSMLSTHAEVWSIFRREQIVHDALETHSSSRPSPSEEEQAARKSNITMDCSSVTV